MTYDIFFPHYFGIIFHSARVMMSSFLLGERTLCRNESFLINKMQVNKNVTALGIRNMNLVILKHCVATVLTIKV